MKKYLQHLLALAVSGIALAIAGCGGGGGDDNNNNNPPGVTPTAVVSALPLPGPTAVGCSNVTQDFSRVPAGGDVPSYWEGTPADNGAARYITDLLADPANTLSVSVNVPNNDELYGTFAGKQVASVLIVCYPTSAGNSRPNYPLPTGNVVPHMQSGTDAPLFADASARYPVIVVSHGYAGSPLSNDYIAALSNFASYGYIALAPFHGDPRISDLRIDDIRDVAQIVTHLRDFVASESLRPLEVSAAIDLLLAHPQYRDHVDPTQIGGFGASYGGATMLLMAGAGLTTSLGFSWTTVEVDRRLKAAVGYVPYFGQPFFPTFGRDQHGLDGVTLPYLAIAGSADTTSPLITTQQGMNRLAGTRELVVLEGVRHGLDTASIPDIYTWSLTWFDAEVRGSAAARAKLATMASVAGGGDDHVTIPYNGGM